MIETVVFCWNEKLVIELYSYFYIYLIIYYLSNGLCKLLLLRPKQTSNKYLDL